MVGMHWQRCRYCFANYSFEIETSRKRRGSIIICFQILSKQKKIIDIYVNSNGCGHIAHYPAFLSTFSIPSIPSDSKKYLKRCFYCYVGLSTLRLCNCRRSDNGMAPQILRRTRMPELYLLLLHIGEYILQDLIWSEYTPGSSSAAITRTTVRCDPYSASSDLNMDLSDYSIRKG
jgi:hypothetical protein